MSLEGFGLSERCIRSMQVIQHSQDSVALVEPGKQTSLEVTGVASPFLFPSPFQALISRLCDFCHRTSLPRSPNEAWVKLLLQLPSPVPSLPRNGGTELSAVSLLGGSELREQLDGHMAVSVCSREPLSWATELPCVPHGDTGTAFCPESVSALQ